MYNCEVLEGLLDYAAPVPRLAACAESRNPSNTSQFYSLDEIELSTNDRLQKFFSGSPVNNCRWRAIRIHDFPDLSAI